MVDGEFMDEVVLNSIGMLTQEKATKFQELCLPLSVRPGWMCWGEEGCELTAD